MTLLRRANLQVVPFETDVDRLATCPACGVPLATLIGIGEDHLIGWRPYFEGGFVDGGARHPSGVRRWVKWSGQSAGRPTIRKLPVVVTCRCRADCLLDAPLEDPDE